MHIVRWRPSRGLSPWRFIGEPDEGRRYSNIFDNPFLPAAWQRLPELEKEWIPAIEMFEKEDRFVVKAELPGMKEEDVDVSVTDDMLTIKGERKTENEVNDEDYYCCERSYGSFFRSIGLPSTVDAKKIEATFEDGVLDISLPKAVETKPKKVKVERKKKEKASK
jgi:HSP20 family protein